VPLSVKKISSCECAPPGSAIRTCITGREYRRSVRFADDTGHEVAGVVEQAGAQATNVKAGDRVVCTITSPAANVPTALQVNEQFCSKVKMLGITQTGAMPNTLPSLHATRFYYLMKYLLSRVRR